MTDNAAPQGDGALSVDQAIGLLSAEPVTETTEAPQEAAPEEEDTPDTEGEASSPEETDDEAESQSEEAETEAEEIEAVAPAEPPKYWSQDAKAKFAQLPPDLQAVVLAQEGPREEAAAKAKAEAAEIRKQADEEVKGVRVLADQLGEFVPKAVETFKSRWDDVDWQGWAQRILHEPDPQAKLDDQAAFNAARLEFEAQKAQVEQLQAAERQAKAVSQAQFIREQAQELQKLAPDLAAKPETMKAVASYLVEQGVSPDQLTSLTAVEAVIAHKAWLYDQAQAKAKAATSAPKPKTPPLKSVASVATAQPASSQHRQAATAKNRFAQTRSVDDAVAFLMSRG